MERFVDALGPGAEEAFMTYADALREEGWQKGEAAIVLRLLSRKFDERSRRMSPCGSGAQRPTSWSAGPTRC